MKTTKEKMFEEAVKRMGLLGLQSNEISDFQNHSKISMTTQICKGDYPHIDNEKPSHSSLNPEISSRGYVWSISFNEPDEKLGELINKVVQEFDGLVYHTNQLKIHDKVHGNVVLTSFLYVSKHLDDWEYEQTCLEKGLGMLRYSLDNRILL